VLDLPPPVFAAVARDQDYPSISYRPAGPRVSKAHAPQVVFRTAGLGLPMLSSVVRGQNFSSFSERQAGSRIKNEYGQDLRTSDCSRSPRKVAPKLVKQMTPINFKTMLASPFRAPNFIRFAQLGSSLNAYIYELFGGSKGHCQL
jgi:hypothetical protein